MSTNSTTVSASAITLAKQANVYASINLKSVENVTNCLAGMMKEMHGGTWSVAIDHVHGFILINASTPGPIQKPKRGEVA